MSFHSEMMKDLPTRMDHQAELQELRWVAQQILNDHDAKVGFCVCPLCRRARIYVKTKS